MTRFGLSTLTLASVCLFASSLRGDTVPLRALIVADSGRIIGERTIQDLSLCGSDLGPMLLTEGPVETNEHMHLRCISSAEASASVLPPDRDWPGSEVRTVVEQGPSSNRIDLSIVGDGYTETEKAKFFEDAEKIVQELFGADTFATYRPLFNVHVVFVPSKESGIGDGRPKKTALGLYRHATTRQAVMPGNPKAAQKAAGLAPDVDFPILLANDRYYGGLGGEFAITTSAPLNLTTVLRHELGHNFGQVGEEYDGGWVYRGGNFSSSVNVPWKHFVEGDVAVHKAKLLHYSAPWQNLDGKVWVQAVTLPSGYPRLFLDFSTLGFDTAGDIQILVDGKPVTLSGEYNYDRTFYRANINLAPGTHTVMVKELVNDKNNILSKMAIYGLEENFPVQGDAEKAGAFLNYEDGGGAVGYRPTNSYCLMRDMHSRHFCSACTETMWKNFLRQISLIDSVAFKSGQVVAEVIPLEGRTYAEWFDPRGKPRADLNNVLAWTPGAGDKGKWTLKVHFLTPEVKAPDHETWSVHSRTVVVP